MGRRRHAGKGILLGAASAAVLCASCWIGVGCGSVPSSGVVDPAAPAWTRQAARTVDGGYIVYVGSARDRADSRAQLFAEGQALTDLAAECSFVPKGARIEDRFESPTGILYTAYVKVAVDFQSCEEAKAQIHPEDIRRLANIAMAREIQRYQDAVKAEVNGGENGSDLSPQTQEALAQSDSPEEYDYPPYGPSPYGPPPLPGAGVTVIQTEPMFWYWRQQVAYEKQTVILAPPSQYQPGSPESQQFASRITAPSRQIQAFESTHPGFRTGPTTYSAFHQRFGANGMAARGFRGVQRFPSGSLRGRRRAYRPRRRAGRRWR